MVLLGGATSETFTLAETVAIGMTAQLKMTASLTIRFISHLDEIWLLCR
jgi:hypothetical protein